MSIKLKSRKSFPWSKKDDNYVIKHYNKKPIQTLAIHLKRTPKAVRHRAIVLKNNIAEIKSRKKWTDEDTNQLIYYYNQGLSFRQISLKLKCNQHLISRRARKCGIYHEYFSDEENTIIKKLYNPDEIGNLKKISKILNRPYQSIQRQIAALNLSDSFERECKTCGIKFTKAKISNKKYCSEKCYTSFTSKRKQQYNKYIGILVKGYFGCAKCKYNKYPQILQFHHINPNQKDFNIPSKKLLRFSDKTKLELDKCIVLCPNCHFEIHILIKENINLYNKWVQTINHNISDIWINMLNQNLHKKEYKILCWQP